MIIKYTKDELRERDSFEESYERLLKELELKLETLRDDPEPDEKKLAALNKARNRIKPPKKGRNFADEQAYLSSPEYQAYLDKVNKNEEEYYAVIKSWEDAGPEEWKAARAEYDRLQEERDRTRKDFYKRCEDRHFNALDGDPQKIYKDATQQVLQYIENRYRYYEKKLENDEYTAFSAIDVNRQADGSFLLDKEESRRFIYRVIDRHLTALEADSKLVSSLKEYIEQILTRSPYVTSEGVQGGIIEKKTKPQNETDEILATRPEKYVTPVDRVTKKVFENRLVKPLDIDNPDALFPVRLDRYGKVIVRVAIDYKDLFKGLISAGANVKLPELNDRDYNVHDAIITLLAAGNRTMSYDMIYRAMTGIIDGKVKVPDDAKEIIDAALDKFKGTFKLEYDYKDEDGETVHVKYDEPLVTYRRATKKINGKLIDGAIVIPEDTKFDPPLLKWARTNGNEIDTRDITLLNVPGLYNGEESLTIKMCLYRRIINMRNAFERIKKSRSELDEKERSIRYDFIYEALGLKELNKDKRRLVKSKVDRILDYWTSKGFISGYEHKKDKAAGNQFYAVVVSFMPVKKLSGGLP